MNAVFAQTSGFDAIASSFCAMYSAPAAGKESGCSDWAVGATSQDTWGSRSFLASFSKSPACPKAMPRWRSGELDGALAYCLNQASALSSKLSSSWYTCQLMPARSSRSGYVVQERITLVNAGVLSMTGPPPVPAGSIIPVHMLSRFGLVGPNTEQW